MLRPDPESNWDILAEIGFRDRRSAIVPSGLGLVEQREFLAFIQLLFDAQDVFVHLLHS